NSANNIDIDADLSAFALTVGNDGYFNADTVTIDTSGVAGANGGAINITSVGDITVTNLTTDGGSGTTTAGNITLDGNNIVLNGLQSVMDTQGTPAAIIKLTSANDIDLKAASFSTNLASMSLTGNGAVSMLTGTADDITWTVSSLNTGTLAGITGITPLVSFTNFANLAGYLGIDTFELANAIDITGTINGGGASDVVNLSTAGQTVQIGPSKYLSIESLTIAGSDNTLQGTINVPTTFIISGSGTGSVGLMSFAGFQTINGGDQVDTFELNSLNNGMTLNGGLGSDILEADLINNTLTADADGVGNLFDKIDQTVNFTSIGVFANNGIGTFIVTGPDIATLYTIDENGSVSYGSSLFTNVNILNGGVLADTFQINGDFGGTVNGMGGADIFQIDTVSLTNATILYGHNNVTTSTANDSIQGIYLTQIGLPVYSWEIDTSSTGKINGALFNDINTLNGSTSVEITDNLSTAIAVNSWAINSSNSTVGTYTFNNMESITGGTGIDTFDVNNVIDGLTISGNGSADILKSDFISNSLAITNATTGNGTLTFTGNTISFNNILAFTNDSIAIGDFILTGPSIGTAYTLDINGSVSLGSLSFNNVDILNAGNNGDSFQIDGDFGVVNGMGGADIFQINTPLLTNTTVLYGHNSSTMSLSDDLIQGLYIGQVGNVTYNWEIDSATTGKINGALFNDINVLSGSTHINITDVLTSNIATNTWAINSISSTVDAYTFNNMEELKGGSGVDIFDINNIIDGLTVDGQAGIDILKADLITNELIITDAITGNGTLTSAGNTISFNNILSFNNDSIAIGDFILTGPSTATSYTLDVNGDVSLGTLLFSNVDVLNAGNSGDSFQIDGDFGGEVNGMGGVDEF
ncbi:MAG: hypothetical protein KAQ67_08545, partial [Gammaproteobacteria bacterium]|nr:hypothetical protein [Gammaproteobacteria bacterium]